MALSLVTCFALILLRLVYEHISHWIQKQTRFPIFKFLILPTVYRRRQVIELVKYWLETAACNIVGAETWWNFRSTFSLLPINHAFHIIYINWSSECLNFFLITTIHHSSYWEWNWKEKWNIIAEEDMKSMLATAFWNSKHDLSRSEEEFGAWWKHVVEWKKKTLSNFTGKNKWCSTHHLGFPRAHCFFFQLMKSISSSSAIPWLESTCSCPSWLCMVFVVLIPFGSRFLASSSAFSSFSNFWYIWTMISKSHLTDLICLSCRMEIIIHSIRRRYSRAFAPLFTSILSISRRFGLASSLSKVNRFIAAKNMDNWRASRVSRLRRVRLWTSHPWSYNARCQSWKPWAVNFHYEACRVHLYLANNADAMWEDCSLVIELINMTDWLSERWMIGRLVGFLYSIGYLSSIGLLSPAGDLSSVGCLDSNGLLSSIEWLSSYEWHVDSWIHRFFWSNIGLSFELLQSFWQLLKIDELWWRIEELKLILSVVFKFTSEIKFPSFVSYSSNICKYFDIHLELLYWEQWTW